MADFNDTLNLHIKQIRDDIARLQKTDDQNAEISNQLARISEINLLFLNIPNPVAFKYGPNIVAVSAMFSFKLRAFCKSLKVGSKSKVG